MNIQEFFDQLNEARNTLTYTLCFDLKTPLNNPDSNIIDSLADNTYDKFNYSFNDGTPSFFGENISEPYPTDFSLLHTRLSGKELWKIIFKNYIIVKTFILLRSTLTDNLFITNYQIPNLHRAYSSTTAKFNILGFDSLSQKSTTPFSASNITHNDGLNYIQFELPDTLEKISTGTSNFTKNLATLNNYLLKNKVLDIPLVPASTTKASCPIKYFELIQLLSGEQNQIKRTQRSYSTARKSPNKFSAALYEEYQQNNHTFWKQIYDYLDAPDNSTLNESDKLYLKYQIESLFDLDLIDTIAKNVLNTSYTNEDMTSQDHIDHAMLACLLPNIFTRKYIVSMAYDCLKYDDYNQNLIFYKKYESAGKVLMFRTDEHTSLYGRNSKYYTWELSYIRMISYLTNYAFPICQNLFMCMLFDVSQKTELPEIILDIYTILSDYICENNIYEQVVHFEDVIYEYEATEHTSFRTKHNKLLSKKDLCLPELPKTTSDEHIIDTFKRTLIAYSKTRLKKSSVPDFISLSYLKSLTENLSESFQAFFLLSAANDKQQ